MKVKSESEVVQLCLTLLKGFFTCLIFCPGFIYLFLGWCSARLTKLASSSFLRVLCVKDKEVIYISYLLLHNKLAA